ncbi:MAG: addiction module protein [Thermoguttaceae bacterium]|jgi:putative addiction module component (TIGR02574 family)|nr:addiction module protein [Thermoguttaceae bacterium]
MQIELVEQVWDRLAHSGWRPALSDEQKAEIDRRLEAHAANPNDVVTWDAVVESLTTACTAAR